MKKKVVSVIISLILAVTMLLPAVNVFGASSVWGGGVATPTLSGGYYQIDTGEKLAWFARQVNSGSSSIKAKLTNDIMLNSTGTYTYEWTPIGTEANPFKGEFDGNGHYISGVYIRTQREYNGLFGYVYSDKPVVDDEDDTTEEIFTANPPEMIHDLEVKSSQIVGLDHAGGICGYIHYGIISGCSYSGTISSYGNNVGGICGEAFNFSKIEQCFTKGSVTGVIRTGGIVGFANTNVQVNECYSEMTITSNASVNGNAGGIAGALSASKLKGAYFMGSITGPKRVGGIVGYNSYSTVTSCYCIGSVSSSLANPEYVNAIAGYSMGCSYLNCYYCEDMTGTGDKNATARTVADMKKFTFVRELNENANAFSYDYMNINNGYPVLVFMLETSVWTGGIEQPSTDSSGTYLIESAENLAWFEKLVNGTLSGYARNTSANAKLIDNLLLNIFITDDTSLTNVWTPIGSESYPYNGTFNGNGYNITGVYVNGEKNQGLFGYIGTSGNVSGVVMLDGQINGTENVGAVAGYNKGTISLSCNDGVVNGQKAVGGICGYNTGIVQTSYNQDTVNCTSDGGSQIGGICGYNTRAYVRQCFNNGLVTGVANSNYYGGICGFNSGDGVYNCYNSGKVLGGFYVGGLIGYNSTGTVKYCLNYGNVNSLNPVNSNTNNFIGYNYGTCTMQYCYIDSTIQNTIINNLNGATAKTTAELTGGNISTELGFPTGVWVNCFDENYYRFYPQLQDIRYSTYEKYKDDSIESVRMVKESYNVKLKIDGRSDSYFADFPSALTALGVNDGTIIPIRSITLDSAVNLSSRVKIHGENYPVTITRASTYTGALFNVTGKLTLGDYKDGSDDNILLIIDGNSAVTATDSLISLGENAELITYEGWKITGAKSSVHGAALYMGSNSTVDYHGGVITGNTATGTTVDAGAVYNDMGTFNMTGGEISSNTSASARGGAIFNNSGVVNISGGEIKNNYGKTFGGALVNLGTDAEINISGDALISGNYANAGGAVMLYSGTVNMTGGTIKENFAYKKNGSTATTGGGGGVTINTSGKFVMSGGTICDNYVYDNVGYGFGVTVFGTFEMSADALISNNDVYIYKNRKINITSALNASGTAAVITPALYETTNQVLTGDALGVSSTKFEVTPSGDTAWYVNSVGYLMNTPINNVASLSKFGAYAVDYVSVAQAVSQIAAGESGIITIIGDNTINETIKVYGDVTILSETDQTFTSMRGGSFKGTLFEVQPGGTLTFGFTEAEKWGEDVSANDSDEETIGTDSVGGEYILDGGYAYNQSTGTSMITVLNGGTLYTYDDFTMTYGYSPTSGNIVVNGTMNMYGGTLRNNTGKQGGAINIGTTGVVNLLGGSITGNNIVEGGCGKAIYNAGTLKRIENIYEYIQDEEVVATKNTFVSVRSNNDVYLSSGKTVILDSTVTDVLLSGTSSAPESVTTTADKMVLSAPAYYAGMPVVTGENVGLHYTEFEPSDSGYYINVDGTIGYLLLVPSTASGLKIDREAKYITGVDITKTVGYYKTAFLNSGVIEIKDKDGNIMADTDRLTTGSKIILRDADGIGLVDSATVIIYGDVDCDGFVDAMDATIINAISQGMYADGTLTAVQLLAADTDTGGVTSSDVLYVESCGVKLNSVDQSR